MGGPSVVALDDLIDRQGVRASTFVFLAVAILVTLSDGYDLAAVGFVVPELVKQWRIPPAELAPILSSGLFGLLAGAPLFGYLGDRIGRKQATLLSLAVVGGFTLAAMAARSVPQFVALRFLAGLGIGGVFPNVVALTAEMAPKGRRGMFIVITNFGTIAGIAVPGYVAASLVPAHGWPALLLVGGVLPLAAALLFLVFAPESIRFLANRRGQEARVRRMAQRLRPDLAFGPDTRFIGPAAAATVAPGSPRGLFAGGLAGFTVAIWLSIAANQMANFFALSWLPTVLQAAGASTVQAGLNASAFAVGGMLGQLALAVTVDRFGAALMAVLFAVGVPLTAATGTVGLGQAAFAAVVAGAGFCVAGNNAAINALAGAIYPTPVRALGAGWTQAMGRLGALAAPLVGSYLLASNLPRDEVLLAPAASLAIGAVASLCLAMSCLRRFGTVRIVGGPAPAHGDGHIPAAASERQTLPS